jgi:hypothetical protein
VTVVIEYFDGDAPGVTAPMRIQLIRHLKSQDGAEYWLGKPEQAIFYPRASGPITINYVVVSPGWVGCSLKIGFTDKRINLAYVVDPSQVGEDSIDFAKCDYVAIGSGSADAFTGGST